jgi:hypothetical protein
MKKALLTFGRRLLGSMRALWDPWPVGARVRVLRGRYAGASGTLKGYSGADFYRVSLNSGRGTKSLSRAQLIRRS